MNALTKLFVTLLIVCSLLLTGGVVVFVNKTDAFQEKVSRAEAEKKLAISERDNANRAANAAQNQAQLTAAQFNALVDKSKEDAQSAETKKAELQANINKLESSLGVAMFQNTDQSAAIKQMTQNIGAIQSRLEAAMKDIDTTRARNTEIVGVNTDLQKTLDATKREIRNLTEQLVQHKADLDRALKVIQTAGLSPTAPILRPVDDIEGFVRTVKTQNGVTSATISLGSVDRIEKGMKFAIYNASTRKYLATITISAVEPNESFGHLSGPAVSDVVVGNKVIPDPSPLTNR